MLPWRCRSATYAVVRASVFLFLTTTSFGGQGPPPERVPPGPIARSQNQTTATAREPTKASAWTRIYIKDVHVRDAVRQALQGADDWLRASRCQELLSEFSDRGGRVLSDRLAELKMTLAEYLSALIVEDGERHPRCGEQGVLAFTVVGSRVIHVCGRAFARAAQRDAQEGRATIVHELLPRSASARIRRLPATSATASSSSAGLNGL